MSIFDSIEQISNHGTEQGIIPRFYLQIDEMMTMAYGDQEGKRRSAIQFQCVLSDFTSFYDLFDEIDKTFQEYKSGVLDGTFCKIDSRGVTQINRMNENKLNQLIKDFFIKGRLLLNNWAKSKVLDNELFELKNLLIVKDDNFEKNSLKYLDKDESKRYEYLFDVIRQARKDFLADFNQIRADYEHSNFKLQKFSVGIQNGAAVFEEPQLMSKPLMTILKYYYQSVFDFIEILMVYKIGIDAYFRTKGVITLYERKEYNLSKQRSRFVLMPRHNNPDLIPKIT